MGGNLLLSPKGLLQKDWKKTQNSFNRTSPPHVVSGAFIIYGEHVMGGT